MRSVSHSSHCVPPTGRRVRAWHVEFLAFGGARIVADWAGTDWLGALVQLGAVPDPWAAPPVGGLTTGDVGHAYVALSTDAGRTFGAPVRLDDEAALGRVDVAVLPDGAVLASWIDLQGTAASFAVRRVSPDGRRSAMTHVARLDHSRASGYPRLAAHGDEIVFAWTEPGSGSSTSSSSTTSTPGSCMTAARILIASASRR